MFASPQTLAIKRTRVAWLSAARRVESCLLTLVKTTKFLPTQPRVPAGNPNGGQWVGADITLIGGFAPEDMGKTVQSFVSENCKAYIYEVLPGQFLDMSIADVTKLGNSGDAPARRCLKLLRQDEYRKRK